MPSSRLVPVTRLVHPTFAVVLAAVLLALPACGGGGDDDAGANAGAPGRGTTLTAVSQGLSTPESVLWSAAHDTWFVSNINGNPSAKDDNGFIVRLSADGGVMDTVPFINGADDDITLHAPKGLAILGDTLWVTDIDAMRGFNVSTGMLVASVDLAPMGATFLNDAFAAADKKVYITDTGISFDAAGNVTTPGKSRVFVLDGRRVTEGVVLPDGSGANGIAWDPGRGGFLIMSFATKDIYAWKPSAEAQVIAQGAGGADGLVILSDGRALYSSWTDSTLHALTASGSTALRAGFPDPADLGYDPAREVVAIPLFTANRVEFLNVPPASARTP